MLSQSWRRALIGTTAGVIGVTALLLGGYAFFGYALQRDAAQARLSEQQVEEQGEELRHRKYDELIHAGRGILERAQTIILVRVVKRNPATLEVLKSWRGPFSAGRVLHIEEPLVIEGNLVYLAAQSNAWQHLFQGGDDELLLFTSGTQDAIFPGWGWASAEAQALIRALDQAVKEIQELEDPQTDIARAPERLRVMQALKECFANASKHPEDEIGYAICQTNIKLHALAGIKRSELVANWGLPKWCRRLLPPPITFLPPTETGCPPEQEAVWTFGHRGSNLYCPAAENLRCMSFGWLSIGGP